MEGAVQHYYSESLAPSTKKVYNSGQKRFLEFCSLYKIVDVLPVTQELLCYFAAYLGRKGLGHSTVKSYLASVRSLQIDYGLGNPFDTSMPRLDRILKGIKVDQGKQGRATKRKLPITPRILRRFRAQWSRVGKDYEETLLWATATVCFFGFMRAGELMMDKKTGFDPTQHLALADIATDDLSQPTMVQITIKQSKTDPFRRGVDIVLGATGNDLCPVKASFDYLKMRGGAPGPLLIQEDGSPLTRPHFVARVRQALIALGFTNASQYSGHSFRAGAATTAAAMNLEDSIIKTLGRWESAAYLLYVRIPREELKGISSVLSKFGTARGE